MPVIPATARVAPQLEPAQNAPEPHRVDQWELAGTVGEGSLTRVYRARAADGSPGGLAPYALKMLRAEWQHDARAVAVVRREARVGREVTHPHLIPILAHGLRRPPIYVVMPWLDGMTLAQRLASEDRRIDLPSALWIARQAAEALDALHREGWTHGDVKPANVFLSAANHVTLLDLGFARRRGETGSIVDRCVTGTGIYLAPEMITSALKPDIRSDVYGLGVVLFEMLAGRPPFRGATLAELAAQHCQARAPDLRRLVPEAPAGVARLVADMLAKQPLRRPQTPAELIDRLVRLEIANFARRAG